jgi:hypothetical protein
MRGQTAPGSKFKAPLDVDHNGRFCIGLVRRGVPREGSCRGMLVTCPTIGRLALKSRKWAQRRLAAGRFGPVVRKGRTGLVDLTNVEAALGTRFTPEQIERARNKQQDE